MVLTSCIIGANAELCRRQSVGKNTEECAGSRPQSQDGLLVAKASRHVCAGKRPPGGAWRRMPGADVIAYPPTRTGSTPGVGRARVRPQVVRDEDLSHGQVETTI